MKRQRLELYLLIVVAIGAALAVKTGWERSHLTREFTRLTRITGDLPIGNPSQVHVQALETGKPRQFAWHVYYPPSYQQVVISPSGRRLWFWTRDPIEFIARVVLRPADDGGVDVYMHFPGRGNSGDFEDMSAADVLRDTRDWQLPRGKKVHFGDKALGDLLRDRWDMIRVTQLGAPQLALLGAKQPAILLRLTLPDDLQAEARSKLPPDTFAHVPVLLELKLGRPLRSRDPRISEIRSMFQTPPPDQPADNLDEGLALFAGLNVPAPAVKPRARTRWHVSVRSLVLLTASIAVWLNYVINRRHNTMLEARISAMVPVAHELLIDDPKRIAVVALDEWFFDENRWDLYLPDGPYRLCLATRGIDFDRLAPVVKSALFKAGRHHIALDERRDGEAWRITVAWDGTGLMTVDEPSDWRDPSGGSVGSSDVTPWCQQRAADYPVVLLRRRFHHPDRAAASGPSDPTEGILLWVEKVGAACRPMTLAAAVAVQDVACALSRSSKTACPRRLPVLEDFLPVLEDFLSFKPLLRVKPAKPN